MDVSNLIEKMHISGIDLHVESDNLRVNSASRLNDEQRLYLKQHKTEILRYLLHLEPANQSNYTLWFYQIDNQGGYTRMGLMTADHCHPAVPMDKVIANELEIVGSHGMQAHKYSVLLAMIQAGKLCPEKLIGKTISLEESLEALANMDNFDGTGVTVINEF